MEILQNIGESITEAFSKAVEASIAVALVKDYSFSILDKAKKSCKVRMMVGVNLPTPVEVLKDLRKCYASNARIYQGDFFHPKVYLFRMKDNSLIAYVGSANFTNSGLNSNVELSVAVTDQSVCEQILEWFNNLYDQSEPISDNFLANYSTYATKWVKLKKEQEKDFQSVTDELDVFKEQKTVIEQELQKRRNLKNYADICKSRKQDVEDIREAIDYYNDFKHIDVDSFLSIGPLGNIRQSYKKQLKDAVKDGSLRRLFKHLCNDSIPVEQRITDAIEGDYKVFGCGRNIFTKVMTVHNPKKYVVYNDVTKVYLDRVHLHFMRGTKFAEQYRQICQIFSEICKRTDIRDFAVLDEILYRIKNGYD